MFTHYRPEVTIQATNKFLDLCAAKTDGADEVVIDALKREYDRLERVEREWIAKFGKQEATV